MPPQTPEAEAYQRLAARVEALEELATKGYMNGWLREHVLAGLRDDLASVRAGVQAGDDWRTEDWRMREVDPAEIEGVLKQHISTMTRSSDNQSGGINVVAEILNLVDRSTEKNILGVMERENPDLAIQIKNLMFVFEDVLHLGDREIQRVLKDVDSRDLAVALKLASEDVKTKIFGNLSQRAAEMLKDELDFLGPVRLKNVEDAQRRIVDVVRKLDEGGEIHISRGGAGEELIV